MTRGNYNECMVQVNLVDKRPPVIVDTLPNITVSCGTDTTNLNALVSIEHQKRQDKISLSQ